MLNNCGIYVTQEAADDVKTVVREIHLKLKNEYIINLEQQVNNAPKCSILYKHIKPFFEMEYYLTKLPYSLRISISRIRTCNHRLPIEIGRYGANHVPREERACTKCESGQVGDEYHFILMCNNPTLVTLREKYIPPYYTIYPSMDKLKDLFCNRGRKLFKLARYVEEGLKLY